MKNFIFLLIFFPLLVKCQSGTSDKKELTYKELWAMRDDIKSIKIKSFEGVWTNQYGNKVAIHKTPQGYMQWDELNKTEEQSHCPPVIAFNNRDTIIQNGDSTMTVGYWNYCNAEQKMIGPDANGVSYLSNSGSGSNELFYVSEKDLLLTGRGIYSRSK